MRGDAQLRNSILTDKEVWKYISSSETDEANPEISIISDQLYSFLFLGHWIMNTANKSRSTGTVGPRLVTRKSNHNFRKTKDRRILFV